MRRRPARAALCVYLDVFGLPLEVDAVVEGVLLGDGDEAGVWACCACNGRSAWKRRRSCVNCASCSVSGLFQSVIYFTLVLGKCRSRNPCVCPSRFSSLGEPLTSVSQFALVTLEPCFCSCCAIGSDSNPGGISGLGSGTMGRALVLSSLASSSFPLLRIDGHSFLFTSGSWCKA
jgi:hypothetical protein